MAADGQAAAGTASADRRLLRAATRALLIRGLGPAVAFLMSVLIARLLGAEGAGVFYLALTLVLASSIAARCGLDTTLLRHAGAAWGQDDVAALHGLKRRALWVTSWLGGGLTLLLVATAERVATALFASPEMGEVIRVAAFAVVPAALVSVQASLLKAIARPGWAALVEGLGMPLLVTGLLAVAALLGPVDATAVAVCYLAGNAGAALFAGRVLVRQLPRTAGVTLPGLRGLLSSSVPLLWVDLLNFALAWTPLLLIGALAGSNEAGIYNAAQRLALQVGLLVMVFGSVTAPRFAALHAECRSDAMARLALRTTRQTLLLASPLLLVLVVWAEPILALFGPEFVAGATPLRILVLGQLINALSGPAGYLLVVSGHERDLRNCQFITVAVVLILGVGLITVHGALGAAIAAAIGLAFNNLACLWLVHRRMDLQLHPGRLLQFGT